MQAPVWDESFDVWNACDDGGCLQLQLWDDDTAARDGKIGQADMIVSRLLQQATPPSQAGSDACSRGPATPSGARTPLSGINSDTGGFLESDEVGKEEHLLERPLSAVEYTVRLDTSKSAAHFSSKGTRPAIHIKVRLPHCTEHALQGPRSCDCIELVLHLAADMTLLLLICGHTKHGASIAPAAPIFAAILEAEGA